MAKKKILMVDDEENFTNLVRLNLNATGKYEVIVENDGKKALLAVKNSKPDLIFLDVIMPDITGAEVARQLAEDSYAKEIPIIFLTAIVDKEEVGMRGGLTEDHTFIAKPVTVERMIDIIEEHIK